MRKLLTPNQTIAISKTSEEMSSTSSFVDPTIDSMGYHALSDNKVYHNMATSDKEARGLVGLLPRGRRTSEETETLRAKKSLDACGTDFERYKVFVGLQNRDEQTFYNLLRANVEELLADFVHADGRRGMREVWRDFRSSERIVGVVERLRQGGEVSEEVAKRERKDSGDYRWREDIRVR